MFQRTLLLHLKPFLCGVVPRFGVALCWTVFQSSVARAEAGAEEAVPQEPDFAELVELNSSALFGGKAKVTGDQVEIVFDRDGQMLAGFEGKGLLDSTSSQAQGSNRNFILLEKKDDKETLVPGLCAMGMGDGAWVSRFRLAGTPWVQVNVRVPNLIGAQSNLKVRVNWERNSGYETSFFNSVSYVSNGNVKAGDATERPEFKAHASKWFPRHSKTANVKVGFGLRDGKCQVEMDDKPVAELSKAFDKGGKIAFQFTKLTFTIDNLKIRGKLDRKWTEAKLAALRKAGNLKVKAN